jgi:hypothetical protein
MITDASPTQFGSKDLERAPVLLELRTDDMPVNPIENPNEAAAVAEQTSTLLRVARSLQRRASKLVGAASNADSTTRAILADMVAADPRTGDRP